MSSCDTAQEQLRCIISNLYWHCFVFPFCILRLILALFKCLSMGLLLQRTSLGIFKKNSGIGKPVLLHKGSQRASGRNWR